MAHLNAQTSVVVFPLVDIMEVPKMSQVNKKTECVESSELASSRSKWLRPEKQRAARHGDKPRRAAGARSRPICRLYSWGGHPVGHRELVRRIL